MNIDELLTYEDIAELTGISLNTLYQWKARGKLPEPDLLFRGPLWYPNTIKEWWSSHGRPALDNHGSLRVEWDRQRS